MENVAIHNIVNIVELKLLSLQGPAYKVGPWLVPGN